ncbi:MAG: MaoC family dehydratase [Pseudomonadota bacterium]
MPSYTPAALAGLVGEDLGTSAWLTVDQAMIDAFADATGDHQWIHVDRARAKAELGGTIAHGYLTLSLLPRLMAEVFAVDGVASRINYGLERVRFPAPVPAGAELRLRVRLSALQPAQQGWRMTLFSTVELKGSDRPACVAETVSLLIVGDNGA